MLSRFSHVWLFCDSMDYSWPASSVHEIFQARIVEWVAGDIPDPGIKPMSLVSPELAGGFFTTVPPGKPLCILGAILDMCFVIIFFPVAFLFIHSFHSLKRDF